MNAQTLEPSRLHRSTAAGTEGPSEADLSAIASAHLLTLIEAPGGVAIRSRRQGLRRYVDCFVGAELVDCLCQRLACSRAQAERLGKRLLDQGHVEPVTGGQDFLDGPNFYRLVCATRMSFERSLVMPLLELADLARAMRGPGGVRVRTHRYRLIRYPACFVGSAATDWLVERLRETRPNAVLVGDSMLRANYICPVFDEPGFRDGQSFYRFL